MKRVTALSGAFAVVVLAVGILGIARIAGDGSERDAQRLHLPAAAGGAPSEVAVGSDDGADVGPGRGVLYGRVTMHGGEAYEGRLRFGGTEEAFWSDWFNGNKRESPWAAFVDPEQLEESRPLEIFGLRIADRKRAMDLSRPFMARFGDLARIDAGIQELRATLKSGTVVELARFDADDFADGVRVWDRERGVTDLTELGIRSIELLPTRELDDVPQRLFGTVRTRTGDFTGFLQWNREKGVAGDELLGRGPEGEVAVRFDSIRSIARESASSSRLELLDGRELVLSGSAEAGRGHRGIAVGDPRYGRVLVSWDAFQRVDFGPGSGSGPGYEEFPPGRPLQGRVVTAAGRELSGRLVYDLDESETTDTLDAPAEGLDYSIPFGRIARIELPGGGAPGRVALRSGEELELERRGDLGEGNAGMLVFEPGRAEGDGGDPEYVRWSEVARIELDDPRRPSAGR